MVHERRRIPEERFALGSRKESAQHPLPQDVADLRVDEVGSMADLSDQTPPEGLRREIEPESGPNQRRCIEDDSHSGLLAPVRSKVVDDVAYRRTTASPPRE